MTPESLRCPIVSGATLIALLLATAPAHAANEAAAEALFAEAKKLVAKKQYAEACPKFAESNRLDRGAGTLIHLADCYEKNGQTASAWAAYLEASSAAQALGRKDWQTLAGKRAAVLEPQLARIKIEVASPAPGLEVTRDGEKVAPASFGVALPVDPGQHALEARAPNHQPFTTSVTITKPSEVVTVAVPKLTPTPGVVAGTQSPAKEPSPPGVAAGAPVAGDGDAASGNGRRTLGLVIGGVGVAGLAAGAITGLMAVGANGEAKAECATAGACASRSAVEASEDAKTYGLVSTVAFGAGAGLTALGAVLFFTAKPSPEPATTGRLRITPSSLRGGAGFILGGTF